MAKNVVVTGTRRGVVDLEMWLERYVDAFGWPDMWILGDARGVDEDTMVWIEGKGRTNYVVKRVDKSTPSPKRYYDRNQEMVDEANGDGHCLAFPDADSRGTWDCVRRARKAGLKVMVHEGDENEP